MIQEPSYNALVFGLQRIVHSALAGGRHKEMAASLLSRFETPIAVRVMGPDAKANALVASGLSTLAAEPAVRLALQDDLPRADPDAFAKTDIAIWCSFAFSAAEQQIWAHAPETLKDRSVLIRLQDSAPPSTPPLMPGLFDEVLTIPVGAHQGMLAHLAEKLRRRVQSGRRADADNAAFVIDTCKLPDDENNALLPAAAPPPEPKNRCPVLMQLDAMMGAHSATLQDLQLEGGTLAAHVLSTCETLLDQVSEVMETAPAGAVPAALRDDIEDASDSIVLMALEGGAEAAADAICTLIQLRKELHLELAA